MKKVETTEYVALILIVAALIFALLHWERVVELYETVLNRQQVTSQPVSPSSTAPTPIPSAPTSAAIPQLPPPSPHEAALPSLEKSDGFAGQAIEALVGRSAFERWFVPENLILHIVATIDNLARQQAPVKAWPVRPLSTAFRVDRTADGFVIAADNAQRYMPYVQALQEIDTDRLVQVYWDLYPLFQSAYRELGYPTGEFNDRLLAVITNLLAAPEPKGEIRLVQPHVLYQYADPSLEAASAGQKLLMRMGLRNEDIVKTKLRRIRIALMRHAQGDPKQPER